jgi:hypothetical protein
MYASYYLRSLCTPELLSCEPVLRSTCRVWMELFATLLGATPA